MFVAKNPVIINKSMLMMYLRLYEIKYIFRCEFDVTARSVGTVVQKLPDTRDRMFNVEGQLRQLVN
jgi:hypothetical protein